jgi:hypothetical protein
MPVTTFDFPFVFMHLDSVKITLIMLQNVFYYVRNKTT